MPNRVGDWTVREQSSSAEDMPTQKTRPTYHPGRDPRLDGRTPPSRPELPPSQTRAWEEEERWI
jgi:hypothetical protein